MYCYNCYSERLSLKLNTILTYLKLIIPMAHFSLIYTYIIIYIYIYIYIYIFYIYILYIKYNDLCRLVVVITYNFTILIIR